MAEGAQAVHYELNEQKSTLPEHLDVYNFRKTGKREYRELEQGKRTSNC